MVPPAMAHYDEKNDCDNIVFFDFDFFELKKMKKIIFEIGPILRGVLC